MSREPVSYDLSQITSPTNRQRPRFGDPCHTLTKDGVGRTAIVYTPPLFHPEQTVTQQNSPLNGKTIGSLFAGIGGFDLGFERAGFTTKWTCEIDPKAQAVLRLRFPHATHHDDVTQVGAHNLEPVDVVTFGSPCQDLSVAGKRAGLAGERSGLFHAAVDVISGLRAKYGKPDFAIWENVPGAFSSNQGRDFAAVLQALADIGATDLAWRVVDSRFFGVAQRRRRVFLVVDFGGERAAEILALAQGGSRHPAPRRQARKGSSPGLGYSPATSGAVTSKWAKGGGPAGDEHYNLVATHVPEKSACLETTANDYSRADGFTAMAYGFYANEGSHGMGDNANVSPAIKIGSGTGAVPPAVAYDAKVLDSYNQTLHDVSPPLRVGAGNESGDQIHKVIIPSPPAVAFNISPGRPGEDAPASLRAVQTEVAHAVTVTEHAKVTDRGTRVVESDRSVVRRLTPVECCRLQGFPDDWNSEGITKEGKRISMADAPRYRQLGNAVTVNVANWIANNLARVYDAPQGAPNGKPQAAVSCPADRPQGA